MSASRAAKLVWFSLGVAAAAALISLIFRAEPDEAQGAAGESISVDPRLAGLPYLNTTPFDEKLSKTGVVVHDAERSFAGYNVFCSEGDDVIRVLDMQGKDVHRIRVPGANCLLLEPYRDEDFLVLGKGRMARVRWSGEIVWRTHGSFHHDVAVRPDGKLYALTWVARRFPKYGVYIPVLDIDIVLMDENGQVLQRQSLFEIVGHMVERKRLIGLVFRSLLGSLIDVRWNTQFDVIHANSLEILPHDTSFAKKGHLLLAIRNLDRVVAIDFEKKKLVWQWGEDELEWPHDATLQDGDTVMIFDNGVRRELSRVLVVDPVTRKIVWRYGANDFFTPSRGSAQRLPGGNILVTESDKGRVFEVTPGGERVWEYWSDDVREEGGETARHLLYRMWRSNRLPLPPLAQSNARTVPDRD